MYLEIFFSVLSLLLCREEHDKEQNFPKDPAFGTNDALQH
jgi:hypothetical protein